MNKKKVAIAILILIIIIGTVIFLIVNRNKDKEEESQTEPQNSVQTPVQVNDTLIDYTNQENVTITGERKENNSKALLEEKEFEDMKVTEISLYALNGITNFTATVENTSRSDFSGKAIVIVFLNSDGSEYGRLEGYLPEIKVGETNVIYASTTSDFSNAYNFRIENSQ